MNLNKGISTPIALTIIIVLAVLVVTGILLFNNYLEKMPSGNKCDEVCKNIGTKSEGYYDGCSGKLIRYEKCFCKKGIKYLSNGEYQCINEYVSGQILVGFKDDVTLEQAQSLIIDKGLEYESDEIYELWVLKIILVKVPVGEEELYLFQLQNEEKVEYAEPNGIVAIGDSEKNPEKICGSQGCLKCSNDCVSWEVGVASSCPKSTEEFECECINSICEKKYLLTRSFLTNVKGIKKTLDNDYSKIVVTGYAIYKTKSCSFRTSDPPYPPEAPCARNSGYIILSDYNNARLNNNPENSKTILKENELLIHYVDDDITDSIILGEMYEIKGEDISYNSVNSLGFIEILSYNATVDEFCKDYILNCGDGLSIKRDELEMCQLCYGECSPAGSSADEYSFGRFIGPKKCCEGLVKIPDLVEEDGECFQIPDTGTICSNCGNNVCEEWENKCNCPKDCN